MKRISCYATGKVSARVRCLHSANRKSNRLEQISKKDLLFQSASWECAPSLWSQMRCCPFLVES